MNEDVSVQVNFIFIRNECVALTNGKKTSVKCTWKTLSLKTNLTS